MKIGITCYPTYGGSGVLATELGKALAKRGHEIHFIAYALPHRLHHVEEGLVFHEVSVNSYPLFEYPPYSLALTSKLVNVVKYAGLELLHMHYAIPHATSAVQAREILATEGKYIPVVTTLHGTDITLVGQDPSYAPVVTHSINRSDGVTAVSEYLKGETLNQFDVRVPIQVIPNFVDTVRFRRLPKEHFKQALCPDGEKVVVHVSNFRKVKRACDVVRIFARLLEQGLSLKLLLVGDGPDRLPAEHLARDLGVHAHCRFLGKQEPIEEILSISDVMLMPSGSESFGLAALEGMSCGVPVVSSDIGGLPELNVDGLTGFLCPLDDLECFVDKSVRLLSDENLRLEMSKASRDRAVEEFDIGRIVPQYESYYEEVMDRVLRQPV
ncbi:MAG TPA: N-acetyl-alpha-D-glucosaminyl L-malate synthase BshA [Rhodothermales bacterium]|nr:N-acetyl-alpha-D-glucosaminyl L-malate synthase BshA [Rhodothermales bacterium]